ncbi:MAG: nucleotidyltransferase domain-containing protein [Thermodesulfobacteriota bacterium]|nr:nucleotidyltransferase domain-containing protein [Thermodesulfobacteriota bacterium]
MKHSLPTNIQKENILGRIISALKCHEEIVLAYVFGSFNDSDTFSDIDIAVLTDEDMDSYLDFEFNLEIEIEDIVNYPMDVRVINNAPLSFCQNVIRHGRVILEKDANMRADFMGKILKEYFDFAPFRRRYLREVANAPI